MAALPEPGSPAYLTAEGERLLAFARNARLPGWGYGWPDSDGSAAGRPASARTAPGAAASCPAWAADRAAAIPAWPAPITATRPRAAAVSVRGGGGRRRRAGPDERQLPADAVSPGLIRA